MKRFQGLDALRPGALREPVCTVGMFDGVHRGHRQLLYELRVWAASVPGESCILTFDRHPLEVLKGTAVPTLLPLGSRLLEFERHGIDAVVVLSFATVKDLSPEAFLQKVLLERVGCRHLLLGFDTHLGKDRRGDATTLPPMAEALGIEVRIASRVLDREGHKVGSSAIRAAILEGDLERAANLLGRPFALRGRVVHGAGRGRKRLVATANLDVRGQVLPPDGVYLVRVFRGADTAPGVANLGVRPTFGGGERTLEVHVPGWDANLYGEDLEVRLVKRLREERRFADARALLAQIREDLEALEQAVARGEV